MPDPRVLTERPEREHKPVTRWPLSSRCDVCEACGEDWPCPVAIAEVRVVAAPAAEPEGQNDLGENSGDCLDVDPMLQQQLGFLRAVKDRASAALAENPEDRRWQEVHYQLPDQERWLGYAIKEMARLRDAAGLRCTGYAQGVARYAPKGAAPRAEGQSSKAVDGASPVAVPAPREDEEYAVRVALVAARSAASDGREIGPNTTTVLISEIERLRAALGSAREARQEGPQGG